MKSSPPILIRHLSCMVVAFLCSTSLFFSKEPNVLVIGSTRSFSEGGESGVVHEPGERASQKSIKLDAGKKVPFKVTYLTNKADGLGWIGRVDIPGTLKTLVHVEKKFPYLLVGEAMGKAMVKIKK